MPSWAKKLVIPLAVAGLVHVGKILWVNFPKAEADIQVLKSDNETMKPIMNEMRIDIKELLKRGESNGKSIRPKRSN